MQGFFTKFSQLGCVSKDGILDYIFIIENGLWAQKLQNFLFFTTENSNFLFAGPLHH